MEAFDILSLAVDVTLAAATGGSPDCRSRTRPAPGTSAPCVRLAVARVAAPRHAIDESETGIALTVVPRAPCADARTSTKRSSDSAHTPMREPTALRAADRYGRAGRCDRRRGFLQTGECTDRCAIRDGRRSCGPGSAADQCRGNPGADGMGWLPPGSTGDRRLRIVLQVRDAADVDALFPKGSAPRPVCVGQPALGRAVATAATCPQPWLLSAGGQQPRCEPTRL